MPEQMPLTSQIKVKIAGADIQPDLAGQIEQVVVDQHSHMPHMFTIRLLDSDLSLLDSGPLDLTKEIEILGEDAQGEAYSLIKGEITALEPEFREGMIAELLVRGYDKSHRLYRNTKSVAYLNVTDSDLATQIAGEANLSATVDSTSQVYDSVIQHNQTSLSFLTQRAWRIGFECFVDDGTLYFRKPPSSPDTSVSLNWGQDLLSFRPRMTLAEQVNKVEVRGWDPQKKEKIVGQADTGSLYPHISESRNGAQWAGSFGEGQKTIVDQPVINQTEADTLAAARLNEISGAFVEADGEAFRRPDIRAGKFIELKGLGERLSGKYLVTSATHIFSPEGLKTLFTVSGSRTGLLSEQVAQQPPVDRWPGIVTALVTNTQDPKSQGRVKVKYPWLSDAVESDWTRVAGAGAGDEAGLCILPDVNDEVLVAFIHGDFNQPVVLSGLWNGVDKLPPPTANASDAEKPLVRTWRSRQGHVISMHDDGDKKIEIITTDGRKITLSDQEKMVTIKTSNATIELTDDKITIDTAGEISLKAGSNLKLEAAGKLEIKGATIDIKADATTNIKGALVNIN